MAPSASSTVKVISIAISIACIIANVLVCHIIVRLKTMKTSINYIILNLAILDAIYGFLSINLVISTDWAGELSEPVLPQAYNQSALLAEVLCRFEWSSRICTTVPPVLLMAMAYERYKAIVHPFSTLNSAAVKMRIKSMIACAWLSGLPPLAIDMIIVRYDYIHATCALKSYPWYNYRVHLTVFLITQHLFPTAAILVLYARVICSLRKQDDALGPRAEAEKARRKARKNVMWTIIVVTVVFYICSGIPQAIFIIHQLIGENLDHSNLSLEIVIALLACNSAFNPFAYFIFIKSFRDGFKRVFMPRTTDSYAGLSFRRRQTSISLEHVNESGHRNTRTTSSQPTLLSFNIHC